MPAYNTSPFRTAARLLYNGVAEYLFGKWKQDVSPTRMYVTSVSLAGNVATLGVTVVEGEIPAVGSLFSAQGLANGQYNVTNSALTAVAIAATGVGTISFALVGANQATTADAGISLVPQPLQLEALANGASIAVARPNNSFGGDLDGTVTVMAVFGAPLPTAVTITLQAAMQDVDGQYINVGTVATVANGVVTANGFTIDAKYLFYRVVVSGLNGAGTVAVQIEA